MTALFSTAQPLRIRGAGTIMALSVYATIAIGPLLLILMNSLRTTADIYQAPLGRPTAEGWDNYVNAWDRANFSTYFLNSTIVTLGALVLGVGCATLAGYGLGRFRFKGHEALSGFFLAGLLLPAQLGVVPLFYMMQALGLVDTLLALIIIYAAGSLPLSIFLLTMFFRQLPDELDEAARLDGAGDFRIFRSIMLPLVRPALATVIAVQAAPIWNDFFYPLVLLRSPDTYTLPVGLTSFIGQYRADFGELSAALVIVSLPLIAMFVMATKHVIAGLTAGIGK
jgi:raffinose/stachyose/melibiose transport system permease protein